MHHAEVYLPVHPVVDLVDLKEAKKEMEWPS